MKNDFFQNINTYKTKNIPYPNYINQQYNHCLKKYGENIEKTTFSKQYSYYNVTPVNKSNNINYQVKKKYEKSNVVIRELFELSEIYEVVFLNVICIVEGVYIKQKTTLKKDAVDNLLKTNHNVVVFAHNGILIGKNFV